MLSRRDFMSMILSGAAATCALGLAGCGGQSADEGASGDAAAASGATGISVGFMNSNSPFEYLDEDNELAGYDVETMKLVAEKLADTYSFDFVPDAFSNLLVGMDTGTYEMCVFHAGYTDERAENYLYGEVSTFYPGGFHIGYLKGRTDITDMDSLAGKTVGLSSGSSADTHVQKYLADHPDLDVSIEYWEDKTALYSGLTNGLYDAYIASAYELDVFSSQFDDFLEYSDYELPQTEEELAHNGTYYLYRKDEEELQQAIDGVLQELLDDGTLSELCIEICGKDYTKSE